MVPVGAGRRRVGACCVRAPSVISVARFASCIMCFSTGVFFGIAIFTYNCSSSVFREVLSVMKYDYNCRMVGTRCPLLKVVAGGVRGNGADGLGVTPRLSRKFKVVSRLKLAKVF